METDLLDFEYKPEKVHPSYLTDSNEMKESHLEIMRTEVEKRDYGLSQGQIVYSKIVLLLLLLNNVSNQWQRLLISSAFYYENPDKLGPKYRLRESFNLSDAQYGVLAGPVFSIIFSTLVLLSGTLSDRVSRRYLFGLSGVCWSLTTIGAAFSKSLSAFAFYRMMLGIFEAFAAPAAYSMIPDFFPPQGRAMANAILALGAVIGEAFASLSTILIDFFGWRETYFIIGSFGVLVALLALTIIRDPE